MVVTSLHLAHGRAAKSKLDELPRFLEVHHTWTLEVLQTLRVLPSHPTKQFQCPRYRKTLLAKGDEGPGTSTS